MAEEIMSKQLQNQQNVLARLQAMYRHQRIVHAYLFDGQRGTGKEAVAQYFSKMLLCQAVSENVPCETCRSCRRVNSGNHPNVTMIRPDGQDIKKEQMTSLIMRMTKKGYEQGRQIYIIANAERMNISASNTLLKFLEEPEGDVTAILLTESYQSILPTIQSRCQRISLQPMQREAVIEELVKKEITASMAATVTMLTANIDEAFELASEEPFVQRRKTVLKLVEILEQKPPGEALLFLQTDWMPIMKEKDSFEQGIDLLLYAYRDIVAMKVGIQSTAAFPDQHQLFSSLSVKNAYSSLSAKLDAILQAKKQMHSNMNRTLLMEQLVLNMQEGLLFV